MSDCGTASLKASTARKARVVSATTIGGILKKQTASKRRVSEKAREHMRRDAMRVEQNARIIAIAARAAISALDDERAVRDADVCAEHCPVRPLRLVQ